MKSSLLRPFWIAPCTVTIFLAGCSITTPEVVDRPVLPEITDTTLSTINLNPLGPKDAVRLGILSSSDVRSENLSIDQNANEAVIARSALYPELYAEISPSSDTDVFATAGAGLRYTLYDFGERAARIRAAEAGIEKARYVVLQSIDEAIVETTYAYIDVVVDLALERAAREYERRIADLEGSVRARVEIGVASSVELNDIATGQLNARSASLEADANEKKSRSELASLVGVNPQGVSSLGYVESVLSISSSSASLPESLSDIPSVAARLEELNIALLNLEAEKAGILPRLGARLGANIGPGGSTVTVGPEVSEIISLGGGRKQVVQNAQLEVLRAQTLLDEEVRRVRLDFEQARTELKATQGTLRNLSEIVSLSIKSRDVMLGEYEIGNRELRDLVDAEERIYNAIVKRLEGRRDVIRAQLSLLMSSNNAANRLYEASE